MKSMQPPSAAIFFMTFFYKAGGSPGPVGPPDPLLKEISNNKKTLIFGADGGQAL